MKLFILERIVILDILPREGNFLTLKSIRELRESLGFKDSEAKKFGIVATVGQNGGTDYSWEADEEVNITMNEAKISLIREVLRTRDASNILQENEYSIYEKFVVTKMEEDSREK